MKGDFTTQISVPDVWWIEGQAEYVSYSYRNVPDTGAISEASIHRYALSTLFQSTYDNSDETRTYPWGYLAVRYMFEKHPSDVMAVLAKFRTNAVRSLEAHAVGALERATEQLGAAVDLRGLTAPLRQTN